ncbi:MaoC/PaaZ C-terminal domain-containing protein [Propionivibrio sp.]|uniref:MaoC/PaaZ C-terminal domain-containing protein n=1 Tax=Propionivibrio sp. TaxID=2212460 RepID=UPI00260440B6|nr:MaoC/PaaZ C-terminal domain-containing protein [Propionivibrio sp.]
MNEYRFQDLSPGLSCSFGVNVTDSMMDQFRLLSGDDNPLHSDAGFAQSRGYRDRVVYGMLTASFYSTLVGIYLPGRYALLQGVDASFTAPVFPGDNLTVFGEISSVHHELRQIEIRAHIKNQLGIKVSRAKIRSGSSE